MYGVPVPAVHALEQVPPLNTSKPELEIGVQSHASAKLGGIVGIVHGAVTRAAGETEHQHNRAHTVSNLS